MESTENNFESGNDPKEKSIVDFKYTLGKIACLCWIFSGVYFFLKYHKPIFSFDGLMFFTIGLIFGNFVIALSAYLVFLLYAVVGGIFLPGCCLVPIGCIHLVANVCFGIWFTKWCFLKYFSI
jgi:hypothetical protein